MIQSYLIRSQDAIGEQIKTYKDGSLHVQMVVLGDGSGCPMGDRSLPLISMGAWVGEFALRPNSADVEQALTVSATPVTAGSFHPATTHVCWSTSGQVLCRFRTPIADRGIILPDGARGFWRVETIASASFFTLSGTAWIYLSPFLW